MRIEPISKICHPNTKPARVRVCAAEPGKVDMSSPDPDVRVARSSTPGVWTLDVDTEVGPKGETRAVAIELGDGKRTRTVSLRIELVPGPKPSTRKPKPAPAPAPAPKDDDHSLVHAPAVEG